MAGKGSKYEYAEMIKDIGLDEFEEELKDLVETADAFLRSARYSDYVQCNERIMVSVLLDYYSDIFRLKEFHSIESVRTEKVFAYKAAWIVKRKPLQFVVYTDEEKDIFVNERFAAYLVINECMLNNGRLSVSKENMTKLDEYLDLLLYYFKYRECNPQVVELAIESFKMGTLVS